MEDKLEAKPNPLSEEEIMGRTYHQKRREINIAKTRASVLRKQITEAYEIIENIRFDYLGDTAFRDNIVRAKRGLEGAMSDFLLSDSYWEKRLKAHREMTPAEFSKENEEMLKGAESVKGN